MSPGASCASSISLVRTIACDPPTRMCPSSTTKSIRRPDVGASFDVGSPAAVGAVGVGGSVEMYWAEAIGRDWPLTCRSKSATDKSVTGRLSPSVMLASTSTSSVFTPNCALEGTGAWGASAAGVGAGAGGVSAAGVGAWVGAGCGGADCARTGP